MSFWTCITPMTIVSSKEILDIFAQDVLQGVLVTAFFFVTNTSCSFFLDTAMSNLLGGEANTENQTNNDYDGLGAFRPSTSITDFTSILEEQPAPEMASAVPPEVKSAAAVISSVPAVQPCTVSSSSVTAPSPLPAQSVSPVPAPIPAAAAVNAKKRSVVEGSQAATGPAPKKIATVNASNTATQTRVAPVPVKVESSTQVKTVTPQIVKSVVTNVVNAPKVPTQHPALKNGATGVVKAVPITVTSQSTVPKGNHIVANAAKVAPIPSSKDAASTASCGGHKTEESFKGVAQAAVTNLILSATNPPAAKPTEEAGFTKPVDTSTAHVAALTSNNWVAACAASISGAPPGTAQAAQAAALAAASDPAAAKAARARRATLTADERARQNRDRNREHARNTRLRKKAYVEELKRTLTELVNQRDQAEVERRHEKQRDLEVREVRYRVMEEFLKLRARGSEQNLLARWIAILEDGFTLTLPKADYRKMACDGGMVRRVSSENQQSLLNSVPNDMSKQVLRGANQSFEDASHVASLMESTLMGTGVQMYYHCDRAHFMMDGIKAVLDWTLKATPQNADVNAPSFILKGCMRATFSPASNKLVCAELLFDTGAVIAQLKNIKSQQRLCAVESNALIDSLPPVSTAHSSAVSIVSNGEKDVSSDEEGSSVEASVKLEPQTA